MGRDREARMLAAGENLEVNEKRYKLRPVCAQHLCDLEREALKYYKRQYLQTFVENADLIGGKEAKALIERKIEVVARWDLSDLPQKDAYNASRCPTTKATNKWVEEKMGEVPESSSGVSVLLSMALDSGELTPKQVKEMTGVAPLHGRVRYDQWWVTSSVQGMISIIISSLHQEHPEMTREVVSGWSFTKLAEAARIVEGITTPDPKNT